MTLVSEPPLSVEWVANVLGVCGKIYVACEGRTRGQPSSRPVPLQLVSRGCETRELALPRDGQDRQGFEVDAEGFVTRVERFTFAETAGLRPGARLLRVCGQTLPGLGPEAAAQLLRSAPKVCVTVLPPDESGRPRRSGRARGHGEGGGPGSWPPPRASCVATSILSRITGEGFSFLRESHVS